MSSKKNKTKPEPTRPEQCLNCETTLTDRFCSKCGQDNSTDRLRVGQIAGHMLEEFRDFDLPFLKTIWHLTIRPGNVCLDYTRGFRKRYSNPFRFCLIMCALYIFLMVASGLQLARVNLSVSEGSNPRLVELMNLAPTFVQSHLNTFIFLALPFVALFLQLVSRRAKLNYAEHYVFILFCYGQRMLFSALLVPLAHIYDLNVMRTVVIVMSHVYITWCAKVFYQTNWFIGFGKALLIHITLVISIIPMIILAFALFVVLPAWLKGELG